MSSVVIEDQTADALPKDATLRERVYYLFKFIDADNSGKISRDELMEGLTSLGVNMTWQEIDEMMCGTDIDGDNEIDAGEVVDAVCAAVESKLSDDDNEKAISEGGYDAKNNVENIEEVE